MHSINKTILIEIQQKREVMIDLVSKKGISNDDAIRCSQELDQLIYQYQYFFRKKRMQRGERTNKENLHQWAVSPLPHSLIPQMISSPS